MAGPLQLVAKIGGPPALPDDGIVQRPAGIPVPEQRSFPLVGNPDGHDLLGFGQAFAEHRTDTLEG